MVIVNTVVLVRTGLGLGAAEVGWTLAAYGAGSMLAALTVPRLLDGVLRDRTAMLAGASLLVLGLLLAPLAPSWGLLLPVWLLLGAGNGLVLTPAGRLLRRSAHPGDRPALFAAQFALSHACWLLTYPLAGWVGAALGLGPTFLLLAAVATFGVLGAVRLWPRSDEAELDHEHPDLDVRHPHLAAGAERAELNGPLRHQHVFVIDELHSAWPR